MHRKKHLPLAAFAALAIAAGNTHAQLLVYEGFDYATGAIDGSQEGGTGFDGAWTGSGSNNLWAVQASGLTFPGLSTTGLSVKRPAAPGSSQMRRTLSAAAQEALTADDTTIWFSLVTRSNFFAGRFSNGVMLFGTNESTNFDTAVGTPVQMTTGEAIGFSYIGDAVNVMSLHGITIDGGTSTLSAGNIQEADGTVEETYMIVGRIDWAPNGSDDTLTLYNVTDPTAGLPAAFATMTADLDQNLFDTIIIGSQQVETFDEIRFGLTQEDVGIASGSAPAAGFQVIITPNGDDFDFTWASLPDKVYDLVTSTDLADPISAWPVYDDGVTTYGDLVATPPTNTLEAVPGDGPKRFFAVVERDAPPPASE